MASGDAHRSRRSDILPPDAARRGLDVRRDALAVLRARLADQTRRRADRRSPRGAVETPSCDHVAALHSTVGAVTGSPQRLLRFRRRHDREPSYEQRAWFVAWPRATVVVPWAGRKLLGHALHAD